MGVVSNWLNEQIPSDIKVGDNQKVGIGGFTLMVQTKQTSKYESTAPISYLEDGSYANDHVIVKPVVLQITGEVSNIYYNPPKSSQVNRIINQNLGVIESYLPARTQSQINKVQTIVNQANDVVNKIDAIVDDGNQLYSLFGNKSGSKSNSQDFFDTIEKISLSKTPISVDMPYRTYDNMVITGLSIDTDNQLEPLSFSIDFIQLRYAKTKFVGVAQKKNVSGGLNGQTDNVKKKSVNKVKKPDDSVLSQAIPAITKLFGL